jgi:hypothetical protein
VALLTWNKSCSVNAQSCDSEHQKLFALMARRVHEPHGSRYGFFAPELPRNSLNKDSSGTNKPTLERGREEGDSRPFRMSDNRYYVNQ